MDDRTGLFSLLFTAAVAAPPPRDGFAPPLVIGPANADRYAWLIGRELADVIVATDDLVAYNVHAELPAPVLTSTCRRLQALGLLPVVARPNRAARRRRK